jgi:hypothetical protein
MKTKHFFLTLLSCIVMFSVCTNVKGQNYLGSSVDQVKQEFTENQKGIVLADGMFENVNSITLVYDVEMENLKSTCVFSFNKKTGLCYRQMHIYDQSYFEQIVAYYKNSHDFAEVPKDKYREYDNYNYLFASIGKDYSGQLLYVHSSPSSDTFSTIYEYR